MTHAHFSLAWLLVDQFWFTVGVGLTVYTRSAWLAGMAAGGFSLMLFELALLVGGR